MTEPPEPPEPPESAEPEPADPAEPPSPPGPTGPPDVPSAVDAPRLLVQALGQLPPEDRDRVYTWLLRTGLPPSTAGVPGPLSRQLGWALNAEGRFVRQQDVGEMGAQVVRDLFRGSSSSAQQMVPVRFSTEQHARLRAWCAEHGFSMATVIRGLVDRFLDSQQAEPG